MLVSEGGEYWVGGAVGHAYTLTTHTHILIYTYLHLLNGIVVPQSTSDLPHPVLRPQIHLLAVPVCVCVCVCVCIICIRMVLLVVCRVLGVIAILSSVYTPYSSNKEHVYDI